MAKLAMAVQCQRLLRRPRNLLAADWCVPEFKTKLENGNAQFGNAPFGL
jgi:hypothetical protein